MVATSGFTHAPVTRALVFGVLVTSLLSSVLEIKHLLPIKPTPHLWPYLQFSRILTFQTAYISSSELLFAAAVLYQFRVLERIWGSRKYASFVAVSWLTCGLLSVTLGLVLKMVTLGWWDYIPPGLTGLVLAVLSAWRDEVPDLYSVKVMTGLKTSNSNNNNNGSSSSRRGGEERDGQTSEDENRQRENEGAGVVLGDKFTTYLLIGQLALSQFPYQLLPAFTGWVVGAAWREEVLPTSMIRWRIPSWVVGEDSSAKSRGQYEGLRRRLEEEGGAMDGMREVSDGLAGRN